MLILSRRIGETLIIGDREVNVTIMGVKGNQVKLGIDAPENVSIHREEVFNKIKEGKEVEKDGLRRRTIIGYAKQKNLKIPNLVRKTGS